MLKPGFYWDNATRKWKPVNYSLLTVEQLAQRRKDADDLAAETEAQLKGLLPVAAAQAVMNKTALELQALIISLAKNIPSHLLQAI